MSGLNSLLTGTETSSTTMPTWYDNAQQKLVSDASTAQTNTPKLADTVAGNAINTLSNPATNQFTQASGALNTIAQGAANPWLTNPATGAVTPNTNTAMGGLFQAQNQQLQTLLPQYEAPATAGSVAGGNFGSLRGQTAANTAVTGAQADLFSKQMAAALQNQQTGVAAGTGLGTVGAQEAATETTLGKAQQADPWTAIGNASNILSTVTSPVTTTKATQMSPISQMGALSSLLNTNPTDIANNVGGILDKIFNNSGSSSSIPGIYDGSAVPGTMDGAPMDTSGSGGNNPYDYWGTDPNMGGGTGGVDWGYTPGTSVDYTGGGYDPTQNP
jgi:hypothetical protein